MKRGEIRWYKFARPDRRRPVLVLTRSSVIPHLGEVTVAPVTSRVRGIPSEVPLGPQDGLLKECAVNCDHLATVSKGKLGGLIAVLGPHKLREVAHSVCYALDLS